MGDDRVPGGGDETVGVAHVLTDLDALLVDIDGTLVDSTPVVERVWRTWAGRYRLDADAILRVAHGRRSVDTIAEFLPRADVAAALAEHEAPELDDLDDVVALPAAASLLAGLPRRRWAAVTSGSRALMEARLAAAGLPVPDVLVAAGDVTAGKPDPQGYLVAAERLRARIGRCLVVEDAPAGVRAGVAAGARVLAVATSHPIEDLTEADLVVHDLRACRVEVTGTGLQVEISDEGRPTS